MVLIECDWGRPNVVHRKKFFKTGGVAVNDALLALRRLTSAVAAWTLIGALGLSLDLRSHREVRQARSMEVDLFLSPLHRGGVLSL